MDKKNKNLLSLVLPVVMTYIPIGATYGVLAQNAGLSLSLTMAMSVFVYAGTAQLIAVGLIAAGNSPLSIALSIFIVNLRYFLYSSVMIKYVEKLSLIKKILFSLQITDETFIVQTSSISAASKDYKSLFSINIISQIAWVTGSTLGFLIGRESFDFSGYGGEFALLALLATLLVLSIKVRLHLILAVLSGILVVLMKFAGAGQFSIILAAMGAAFIGVKVKQWRT